ncbi:hypothetical protein [Ectobacillus panaciterrae]|uniref:hypothetical protein n=1 Tax=Ectobacillus panaciterrae TaxID=363872 RepID=UPI0003FB8541|nr:hypothetical protein [Ectobacillus panaciterrae]
MSSAEVQKSKNHTCIFVSFPGTKMKFPNVTELRSKKTKQLTLCVQLNEQGQLQDFHFMSEGSVLKLKFAARNNGQTVLNQIVKLTANKAEHVITNELSIIKRETEHACEYVLISKEKQAARRKSKRKRTENIKITEYVLFIVPKVTEKEAPQDRTKMAAGNMKIGLHKDKKKHAGLHVVNEHKVKDPMRVHIMRSFEAAACLPLVLLRFLGPGDQVLPLPRAEPRAS